MVSILRIRQTTLGSRLLTAPELRGVWRGYLHYTPSRRRTNIYRILRTGYVAPCNYSAYCTTLVRLVMWYPMSPSLSESIRQKLGHKDLLSAAFSLAPAMSLYYQLFQYSVGILRSISCHVADDATPLSSYVSCKSRWLHGFGRPFYTMQQIELNNSFTPCEVTVYTLSQSQSVLG